MAAPGERFDIDGETYRGSLIPDSDMDSTVTYVWARITPPAKISQLLVDLDIEGPVDAVEHYATTESASVFRMEVGTSDNGYNDTYNKRVQSAIEGLTTIIEILNHIEHDNNGQWA